MFPSPPCIGIFFMALALMLAPALAEPQQSFGVWTLTLPEGVTAKTIDDLLVLTDAASGAKLAARTVQA